VAHWPAFCYSACKIDPLSRGITQDDYDKKARELKERQAEIAAQIEQHQHGDGEYRTTLESLISLASRAAELFERSKIEQKRELIAFVFSNLQLSGKKLDFSLRSPFDLMVNRADHSSWLAFLNTVRTERFNDILGLRSLVLLIFRNEPDAACPK
jgi:site-specific DNA recombinase